MKYILLLIAATLAAPAQATDIRINIESPAGVMQGVGVIQGWIISKDAIIATKYFINGIDKGAIPFGGRRADVEEAYAGKYHDPLYSGFSTTFYYGLLDPGMESTVTIQALTESGKFAEETVSFNTVRFNQGKEWRRGIDMGFATYIQDDDGFTLENVLVDGVLYKSVQFQWNDATQGFTIVEID